MRPLTPQDKRTIRIAGLGLAIYLALFGGFKVWKFFEWQRTDYRNLVTEAEGLKQEVKRYEAKIAVTKKLMESFHMNPARLTNTTVVAEASAAIQKAARDGGFQVGTVRESPARSGGKELSSIQLDGSGPVQATMGLMNRLETCGYPLLIDSAQFSSDPGRPGQVKVNLTIIILNFDPTKKPEVPRA